MATIKTVQKRKCPLCGDGLNQINAGYNRSGTQRCVCKKCNYKYTLDPKQHAYAPEMREAAISAYKSGVSARGVGKMFAMGKANVLKWLKEPDGKK